MSSFQENMYVDSLYVNHIKRNTTASIGICGNQIKHAGNPTEDSDVATKSYVDNMYQSGIIPEIRIGNESSYSTITRIEDSHVDSYVNNTKACCNIYRRVVQFKTTGKTTIYTFNIPIDIKIAHIRSTLVLTEPEGTSMSIVCSFMHNSNFSYYLLPTVTSPYSTPILPTRSFFDIKLDASPVIDDTIQQQLDNTSVVVDDIRKSREITARVEVTHSVGFVNIRRNVRNKLTLVLDTTEKVIIYTLRFTNDQLGIIMSGNALVETIQFS
jgi:hypothetical protein